MPPRFDIKFHVAEQFRARFSHHNNITPYQALLKSRLASPEEKVQMDIQNLNFTGRRLNLNGGETLYYLWEDVVFVGKATSPGVVTIQTSWVNKTKTSTFPANTPTEYIKTPPSLDHFYSYLKSLEKTPEQFSPNKALDLLVKSGVKTELITKLRKKYKGIKYRTFLTKCDKYLSIKLETKESDEVRQKRAAFAAENFGLIKDRNGNLPAFSAKGFEMQVIGLRGLDVEKHEDGSVTLRNSKGWTQRVRLENPIFDKNDRLVVQLIQEHGGGFTKQSYVQYGNTTETMWFESQKVHPTEIKELKTEKKEAVESGVISKLASLQGQIKKLQETNKLVGARQKKVKCKVWYNGQLVDSWFDAKVQPSQNNGKYKGFIRVGDRLVSGYVMQEEATAKMYFVPSVT